MKKYVICLILALTTFVFGIDFEESKYFVYIYKDGTGQIEQFYISDFAIREEACKIGLQGQASIIKFNPDSKFTIYENNKQLNRENQYEYSFYNLSATLNQNPFKSKYTVTNDNNLSSYNDIDSYRLPQVTKNGKMVTFQKYNKDIGILCFVLNPEQSTNFSFNNPSSKEIKANVWGEIEKTSERDIDWYPYNNSFKGVYIKNRSLYLVPKPGAPDNQHQQIGSDDADYVSPIWDSKGEMIYYVIKNKLYRIELSDGNRFKNEIYHSFGADALYKISLNPQYGNLLLYRFMKGDQVSAGIFNLSDKTEIVLSSSGQYDEINPEWSPEGKRVAFVRRVRGQAELGFQLMQFNLTTNSIVPLTSNDIVLNNAVYPKWLPDGSGILFIGRNKKSDSRDQLYVTSANTMKTPYRIELLSGGRSFSNLSDITIFPTFLTNGRDVYLYFSAARGTKFEIYRLNLGRMALNIAEHTTPSGFDINEIKKPIPNTVLNSYLSSIAEVKTVEKRRNEFFTTWTNYKNKFNALDQRCMQMKNALSAPSPSASNAQLQHDFYRQKLQTTLEKYKKEIEQYEGSVTEIQASYTSARDEQFNERYRAENYEKVRKNEPDTQIFARVNDLYKKYDREISDSEQKINTKKNGALKEINQLVKDDNDYNQLAQEHNRLFVRARNSYNNARSQIQSYNSRGLSVRKRNEVERALENINNLQPDQPESDLKPEKISADKLKNMNERYTKLISRHEELVNNIRTEVNRIERNEGGIEGSLSRFQIGIQAGVGLNNGAGAMFGLYGQVRLFNRLYLTGGFNLLNTNSYREINTVTGAPGNIDFMTTDSLYAYNFSEKQKYYEAFTGFSYKINLAGFPSFLSDCSLNIGAGGHFKDNKLLIKDKIQYRHAAFYSDVSDTSNIGTSIQNLALYPFLQIELEYHIQPNLSAGISTFLSYTAVSISGDKISNIKYGYIKDESIVIADKDSQSYETLNSIYLNLFLTYNF